MRFSSAVPEAPIILVFQGSSERHEVPVEEMVDAPDVLQADIPGLHSSFLTWCCSMQVMKTFQWCVYGMVNGAKTAQTRCGKGCK